MDHNRDLQLWSIGLQHLGPAGILRVSACRREPGSIGCVPQPEQRHWVPVHQTSGQARFLGWSDWRRWPCILRHLNTLHHKIAIVLEGGAGDTSIYWNLAGYQLPVLGVCRRRPLSQKKL